MVVPTATFYEKVIKVKADVAALHIFSGDIDDDASGGVESCQGRRLLAFILTLDRSPRHFIIERRTKRNELRSIVDGFGVLLLLDEQQAPTQSS